MKRYRAFLQPMVEFLFTLLSYCTIAIAGAAVGSFAGVIIDRRHQPGRPSPMFGRSQCSVCHRRLRWWEMVPLVSFLLLFGKCRTCRSPIPFWVYLVEVSGAAGFLFVYIALSRFCVPSCESVQFPAHVAGGWLVVFAFILIGFEDALWGVVADDAVIVGFIGAVLWRASFMHATTTLDTFGVPIVTGAAVAAFFYALHRLTRRKGMGTGDATLGALIGFLLGWPLAVVSLWLSFLFGAAVGVSAVVVRGRSIRSTLPFAPFLIVGAAVALVFQRELLRWWSAFVSP